MKVHVILQGKGGVGKSYIAVMFSQYLMSVGKTVKGLDTDPNNATFYGFKGIDVSRVNILNDFKEIEPVLFDEMINLILAAHENGTDDVVIDSGSSGYISLVGYLRDNNVFSLLNERNIETVIHTVVVSGAAMVETLNQLVELHVNLAEYQAPFVVWLNPLDGPIENRGQRFTEFKAYEDVRQDVRAVIELPYYRQEFGRDITQMFKRKMTFDEIRLSPEFMFMSKARLDQIRRGYFFNIENAYGYMNGVSDDR